MKMLYEIPVERYHSTLAQKGLVLTTRVFLMNKPLLRL